MCTIDIFIFYLCNLSLSLLHVLYQQTHHSGYQSFKHSDGIGRVASTSFFSFSFLATRFSLPGISIFLRPTFPFPVQHIGIGPFRVRRWTGRSSFPRVRVPLKTFPVPLFHIEIPRGPSGGMHRTDCPTVLISHRGVVQRRARQRSFRQYSIPHARCDGTAPVWGTRWGQAHDAAAGTGHAAPRSDEPAVRVGRVFKGPALRKTTASSKPTPVTVAPKTRQWQRATAAPAHPPRSPHCCMAVVSVVLVGQLFSQFAHRFTLHRRQCLVQFQLQCFCFSQRGHLFSIHFFFFSF